MTTWIPGAITPAATLPQATVEVPAAQAAIQPGAVVTGALSPLVREADAFKANLAAFLRSERGKHTRLANIAGAGPMGQAMFGGNGALGGPHVMTHGPRAGALVQEVKLGGRVFHIYFHQNGQREVIALPHGAPAQPTGGMLAPS